MQHDPKAEFFLQPEHRDDVVVSMRVPVNNTLSVENLNESFHGEVTRRHLACVTRRLFDLVAIFLSFYELISDEGRRFCACSGKRSTGRTDRVCAVGKL